MEKYLVHNADTLEEMLAVSTDFKERQHIRGALRELKGLKLEGGSAITYSFGSDSVRQILSPRDHRGDSLTSPRLRNHGHPDLSPEGLKEKSWRRSRLPNDENSPRSIDAELKEAKAADNKSTSNEHIQKYRSYLYAGSLNTPESQGTSVFHDGAKHADHVTQSNDKASNIRRRAASARLSNPQRDLDSVYDKHSSKILDRPVHLTLSSVGSDKTAENASPASRPPPVPRKPRKISYRTSHFSSSSASSPFSPSGQPSPRTAKISLTSPKLEGIRSKSAQSKICGSSSSVSPRRCNIFFPNMKSDNTRNSTSDHIKSIEEDSVFDSKHEVNEKVNDAVSSVKHINAINDSLCDIKMSHQNGFNHDGVHSNQVGKENIILNRTEKNDSEVSEGRSTPRKRSALTRKKRVSSDSYKEKLSGHKNKDEISSSPRVAAKSDSVHSGNKPDEKTGEKADTPTNGGKRVKTPRRKLPEIPKGEIEDDETVHARTIRLLQERKKDRHKREQQGRETPDKTKMSPSEIKKVLEEKLERSDSKKKAVRVRRELQLLNRENELKSPRPMNISDLSKGLDLDSLQDRMTSRRKLVQRSKSDIVKSVTATVEVGLGKTVVDTAEDKVAGAVDGVDGTVEFKNVLLEQLEADVGKEPLSPESKINIIGSLMQEEAKIQEMLRKSSNFSEKRKMRAEIKRLREKRVELENFSNKTSEVTVKRCASVTAGLITPATLPDNCHFDMLNKPSINDLRRQLSETTDYDEKKKIRLALRHLRNQSRDGSLNQPGIQRSQSFVHEKSPQPVCNGDIGGPLVARSQSVTDKVHNNNNNNTATTVTRHDSGLPNGHIHKTDKDIDKPSEQTAKKLQFRQSNLSSTPVDNSLSSRDREHLKSGRVSAPLPQKVESSLIRDTKGVKQDSGIHLEKPVSRTSDSVSLGPTSLSRKHSIDSINFKQKSGQDGKKKLLERCQFFENDGISNKTDQTSKPKSSNILISRANVTKSRTADKTVSPANVSNDNRKTKEEILKASVNNKLETDNNTFLNNKDAHETDRKLSPSLVWLENKRKSLPTLRDIDKLMSTMDIEAAFSEILDGVDMETDGVGMDTPATSTNITADIPIVEEEASESSVNEELEAIENQKNAENNMRINVQDQNEINGVTSEMNGEETVEEEPTKSSDITNEEECNNNDKSAIIEPGIKKSEAKIQLQSNLSLDIPAKSESNSAISVIHGDGGTVTVQEVNKVTDGDTTITEWKKVRRTSSRTETRETDTVKEKNVSSPGGTSTVYEKDVSKTKKKLTSRGSEYFSRNNYNIKRVKDQEGAEMVLHELSSENKNLSVSKNESWGDRSEAKVVLQKDGEEGAGGPNLAVNSITAKLPQPVQPEQDKAKERKSVTRTTSMCKIQLSNKTAPANEDTSNALEAQLGRPSGCPNITSPLADISVVEGDTARLECVVRCSPPPTMLWFRGGNQLTEGQDTKFGFDRLTGKAWLELCPATLEHIGDYKCEFENERGSASTKGKIAVKAKPGKAPIFLTMLEDFSVREGQPLTLQCTVADCDTVKWYKDGVIQPDNPDFRQTFDGQTVKMEITELFLDDSGTYTCVLKSEAGEMKTSCNIDVTEAESSHEVFPSFLKKPETQIADEHDTVIFECDIIGTPTPDVSWTLDSLPITENSRNKFSYDGRLARLIIKQVTGKESGKLECIASNSCGRVTAECMLVVKVAAKDEPEIIEDLKAISVESGAAAILDCGIEGASAEDISWSKNGCLIGKTFDFKQTYKDNRARLEISGACKADSGRYECSVNTDDGSISTSCMLTIEDKVESKPEEPQLTVQEEQVQTATVKKFPTRFVPKVNQDNVKAAKSQASKIMLVRQGSWRIPGSEKTESPLKRAGSWQSRSRNTDKLDVSDRDKSLNEPVNFKVASAAVKATDEAKVVDETNLVVKSEDAEVNKSDVDHNKNNISNLSVNLKEKPDVQKETLGVEREASKVEAETVKVETETIKVHREIPKIQKEDANAQRLMDKKQEITDTKASKDESSKVPKCSLSKEDTDIRPKMKFKLGGEIRRTQSVRSAGSEKPEWLQVKLRSVNASKSPLSVQEKQSIEKSHAESDTPKEEKIEKPVAVQREVKLSRSQSARIPEKPALRDSTNSPSNDPAKSVPRLTPVSERAKMFQSSRKSNPSDIIAKAIGLCRAESMRTPAGRGAVNVQRSHSFKTAPAPTAGDVTLDLSPQHSKGAEEKGEQGSSPKVVKRWEPSTSTLPANMDIATINDEEKLQEMLSKTQDFEERKKLRARIKELRAQYMAELDAKAKAREASREDEIKKRHREADLEKQRKLDAFKEQAKERTESQHLTSQEKRLKERIALADANKQRQLDDFDKLAGKKTGDLSQKTTTETKVSTDGRTTTTTRRVETVTKTGGSRPAADELAPVMTQQIINATSPLTCGGSVTVKTESWSSKDGVTNSSEKTESWGGRGGAKNMFKQMDAKTNPQGAAGRGGGGLIRSPSAIKTMLLEWCKAMTREYTGTVDITNFSTSWNDGMAFCALIHHFYPESFDFDSLNPKQRRKNFELAFDTAEKCADIAPLLDVEDMVMMKKPDWKCVFTYVQSFYRKLQNHERNRAIAAES